MTDQRQKRRYELRKRAEGVAETRRRITAAAVDLHASVGPARTTFTAVAEHAGVQRHTLYRHFPTEADLLVACSGHWEAEHPAPDPALWAEIEDVDERLHSALTELYGFYERGEPMLANVLRDAVTYEVLRPYEAGLRASFDAAAAALVRGRRARGNQRRMLHAALRHAVDFATWRSLTRDAGATTGQAVDLMVAFVGAADRRRSATS